MAREPEGFSRQEHIPRLRGVWDLWLRAKKADHRTSHSTVWRLLNALVECGLAHREISPADGILRYGPVKIECTHERVACKDCGANIPRKEANMIK